MIYIAHITFYDGTDVLKPPRTVHCFLDADSFCEAMDYTTEFYGEKNIEKVSFEIFGPDRHLEFDDSELELFDKVKSALEPKQIW